MRSSVLGVLLSITLGTAPAPAPDFRYDRSAPLMLAVAAPIIDGGVETRELQFSSGDRRIAATIVRSVRRSHGAAILFVHWLGDPPTTNRTEFAADARQLAARGAISLLVDAMWAEPGWFEHRTTDDDYAASVEQVVALRRALDVLLAQPDVDSSRVGYVGHDFGAMYGAVLAGIDSRIGAYVFMAPTTTFWEWYLLGVRPTDKYAYIDRMRTLDPTRWLPASTMRASLLQFAENDPFVPASAAHEFALAVPDRDRTVNTYTGGHALANDAARRDRIDWLATRLRLDVPER